MTPNEAALLTTKILGCFNGPPADMWEDELRGLEFGRAGSAFARLRREHDQRYLTIARFMETYRGMQMIDASNAPPKCEHCDGNGWVDAGKYQWRHDVHTAVAPCTHCDDGRAREVSEAWSKATERELITDAEATRILAALADEFRPQSCAGLGCVANPAGKVHHVPKCPRYAP